MSARASLAIVMFALPVAAQQPAPFAHADVDAGKAIADRDCVGCHERHYKPGTAMYTRADRRVTTPAQLLAQVQRCNSELGTSYFPEEEESVAAYLNQAYYKFKP